MVVLGARGVWQVAKHPLRQGPVQAHPYLVVPMYSLTPFERENHNLLGCASRVTLQHVAYVHPERW
jgi:hypothetical protein